MYGIRFSWLGVTRKDSPYSAIGDWMRKAHHESKGGATVVCLIPSRTDTGYWHRHVIHADEIRFIRGRLKFGSSKNSAPFPSAVVIFRLPGVGWSVHHLSRPRAVGWDYREVNNPQLPLVAS